MRVFISYGRKDAADFASKLAEWLRSQGHEPWLDAQHGIPPGAAFDIRIELGISTSDLLVALLSPWSLRPESFCRNELLYALAMRKPVVPVRVADITPPIQVISYRWIDGFPDFETALSNLPPALSEAASAGRMPLREWVPQQPGGAWWATRRQLDFHEELARHGGTFVGRDWLFASMREWIDAAGSRVLLLTSDAGVGKSAIAAQMTARLNVRSVHFCSRSNIESCKPAAWLSGLIYQLAAQFPEYRSEMERFQPPNWGDPPESLFRTLVADPLRASRARSAGAAEPWVFVIDGLDESVAAAGPALADLIAGSAERIPDWLRLIVTSRPDRELTARFRTDGVRSLHVDAEGAENRADLQRYVEQRASNGASRLLDLAAGNFLFAKMTLDALGSPDPERRLSVEEIGALPASLGGLYHAMFQRRFPDADRYMLEERPLLDCLAAARGPVPEALLLQACGPDGNASRKGLRGLSQFLNAGAAGLRLFHQSLADWLANTQASAEFAADPLEGQRRLAEACWREYRAGVATMSAYSLAHLPTHLAETRRWPDLLEAVFSPELKLLDRWVEAGEGDQGLACLTGVIEYLKKNHRETAAGLATQLARIHSLKGDYTAAERWLRYALGASSWRRGRRIRAVALHELGSLLLYDGRLSEAERHYRKALRLCRWWAPVYRDEAAANLVGLGTLAQIRGRFRKTIRLASRAIREAGRAEDARHVIAGERLMGAAYKVLGKRGEAEAHIKTAIEMSQACGAHLERVRLLLLYGYLLYDRAALENSAPVDAREIFREALAQAERVQQSYCIFEAKISLGWCALAMGATDEAAQWFDPLTEALPKGRHADLHAGLDLGLAGVAHQREEWDKARSLYAMVLNSHREEFSNSSWSRAYVGLGAIEWHTGHRTEAESAWKQALRLAGKVSPARKELAAQSIRICKADRHAVER